LNGAGRGIGAKYEKASRALLAVARASGKASLQMASEISFLIVPLNSLTMKSATLSKIPKWLILTLRLIEALHALSRICALLAASIETERPTAALEEEEVAVILALR